MATGKASKPRAAQLEDVAGAKLWADRPETVRKLLTCATIAFAERGYHATTTRDISMRAGLSAAALYVHFKTKESLLFEISKAGHESAFNAVSLALIPDQSHSARTADAIRAFARWHAHHVTLARVVQQELSALDPEHLEMVRSIRRATEGLLRAEVQAGVKAGDFHTDDVNGVVLAIGSLCIDIVRWYTPGSRRTADDLADLYADLGLLLLGAAA